MKCPDCGIEIAALPCERCEKEAANAERVMQAVVEEFSLVRGAPETKESRESLDFALMHLKQPLEKERFRGTVSYNTRDLLRSQRWWYVPFRWIGCMGFIVNLDSGYVNWLGSGPSLSNCFWGHEHGLFCELVDFAFAPDTDLELAKKLLLRFKHMYPNTDGVYPKEPVWYISLIHISEPTRLGMISYAVFCLKKKKKKNKNTNPSTQPNKQKTQIKT